MKRLLILIALLTGLTGFADYMDPASGRPVQTLPAQLSVSGRVIINPSWADYYAAGWRKILKAPRTGSLDVSARTEMMVVGYLAVTNQSGEIFLKEVASAQLRPVYDTLNVSLASSWPLLSEHPATNDIPAAGMTYRLQGNPITWWIVRQNDVLASQLSAHNANGEPIARTVNLINGEEEIINLRTIATANSFAQLRGAREIKTNAAVRARGNPKP